MAYAVLPYLNAAPEEPDLPDCYRQYADVFLEEKGEALPLDRTHKHAIKLLPGSSLTYSLIYSLSERELAVLREYLYTSKLKG